MLYTNCPGVFGVMGAFDLTTRTRIAKIVPDRGRGLRLSTCEIQVQISIPIRHILGFYIFVDSVLLKSYNLNTLIFPANKNPKKSFL